MLEQFLKDLAGAPDDWALRGVFADWAEDHARPELADCLRWMVRRRKRPYRASGQRGVWFDADFTPAGLGDPESNIPGALYGYLTGGSVVAHHRIYPTLTGAEEALFGAWARAWAAGWRPGE
jgi:uncharacterized protein (TIGR02996 family)